MRSGAPHPICPDWKGVGMQCADYHKGRSSRVPPYSHASPSNSPTATLSGRKVRLASLTKKAMSGLSQPTGPRPGPSWHEFGG